MYIELLSLLPQEDACLKLIGCFDKLLHKYARLLSYDDAYNDLLLFFIELITKLGNSPAFLEQSNDGRVVNYIAKSVRNHYIYISKSREHTEHLTFSDFEPDHQRIPSFFRIPIAPMRLDRFLFEMADKIPVT